MYKALSTDCLGFPLTFKDVAEIIALQHYEGFWFNFARDCEISAAETKELLHKQSLLPAGFILPVDLRRDRATFDADMGRLPRLARFAQEVGLTRCITDIAPGSDTREYGENFEHHRRMLSEVTKVLADFGVSLGMEFVGTPERRIMRKFPFVHTLDEILSLCNAINAENCGLLLDSWHWHMAGQTQEDFKKLSSPGQVVLVHINDAPRGKTLEEQLDAERRLPGETGVIDIAGFFHGLGSLGYSGPVIVEPFDSRLAEMPFPQAAQLVMDSMVRVWPSP